MDILVLCLLLLTVQMFFHALGIYFTLRLHRLVKAVADAPAE